MDIINLIQFIENEFITIQLSIKIYNFQFFNYKKLINVLFKSSIKCPKKINFCTKKNPQNLSFNEFKTIMRH